MIDSTTLKYEPFHDGRKEPGFSGPLLMATDKNGKQYIVKHTYPHNAGNEFVGCWLAEKLGVHAPKAYLLTPNKKFNCPYAVAIEYMDGLTTFSKDKTPYPDELAGVFALCTLIDTDDIVQMNIWNGHIVTYDFSETFNLLNLTLVFSMLKNGNDTAMFFLKQHLEGFEHSISVLRPDTASGVADEFHVDKDTFRQNFVATAKKVLAITDADIDSLSDEVAELYPMEIAVYYELCIQAMKEKIESWK